MEFVMVYAAVAALFYAVMVWEAAPDPCSEPGNKLKAATV